MTNPLRGAKQYRADLYKHIEKLLGREMTATEHDEVKKIYMLHVNDHIEALRQTAINQGQRLKVLGKHLWQLQNGPRAAVPAVWDSLQVELKKMGILPYEPNRMGEAVSSKDARQNNTD